MTLLVGCGGNSYVGKWDATMSSTDPQAAEMMSGMGTLKNALELKADDTYVMEIMGQKMEGTYKVDGKTLTMTPNEGPGAGTVGSLTASEDGKTLTSTEQGMTITLTRSAE
jgi:hypothetical protein